MRLLWVKAGRILPVDTGGKIRSYNLLRHLSARHEVTFLSYYDGAADPRYEEQVQTAFPGAVTLRTGYGLSRLAEAMRYARYVPSAAPFAVTKFTVPAVRNRIKQWMDEGRFDVMLCDFLSASRNFPQRGKTPCVLFQHNVESALWRRQAAHEPNPLKRLVFKLESAKMDSYERATVARFEHIVAVSENDRELMSEMTDASRISVVPTGVDVDQYRPARGGGALPLVLFLGSMDWEANVDGVSWFCRDIWPTIQARVPAATFRIVGRNPHPRVLALANDHVQVTGSVPSVVEHLHDCAVFVVPLRVGGGTRLKIFEAMASAKAVVSTRVGAEGLDVTHGKDIVLEDDATRFADAVVQLLVDRGLRTRYEQAAGELADRNDWSVVTRSLEQTLESIALANRSARRAGAPSLV